MYDDESVARYDCEATEEDWLEISYTKRHYIDDEDDFAAPAAVLPHRIRKKKKSGRRSAGNGALWTAVVWATSSKRQRKPIPLL